MTSSTRAKQDQTEEFRESSTIHLTNDRHITVVELECKRIGEKKTEAEVIFWPEDGSFVVLTPEQATALDADAQEFHSLAQKLEAARKAGDEEQEKAVKKEIAQRLKPLVHGPKAQDFTEIIRLIFSDDKGRPRKDGQRISSLVKAKWPEIKTKITADLYSGKAEVYGKTGLGQLPASNPELQKAFADFDRFLDHLEKNYLNFRSDSTSPYFDVSGGAQLMRYYAGASFKSDVDLAKGKLNLKGEAKASFALFEGKVKSEVYFPNRDGHELKIPNPEREPKENEPTEMDWAPCDRCGIPEPTFALDSSFVRPGAIPQLKQMLATFTSSPGARLQIVGHTDKSGPAPYNQALSERRARAVYAFIRNNPAKGPAEWVDLSYQENWSPRLFKQILRHFRYYPTSEPLNDISKEAYINAVRAFQKDTPLLAPNGDMDPTTRLFLFDRYMREGGGIELPDEAFMDTPWLGRGETEPVDPTEKAHEPNRRVSFYLFNEDETDAAQAGPQKDISIGHMRADLELAVFAFAGASVMGSANIEFSVKDGKAYLRGGEEEKKKPVQLEKKKDTPHTPEPVSAKFSALFGAQAGCEGKGKLQWKSCETENKFEDLASIGYVGTGNAGAGLEAEFNIRFEDLKFMIRAKAGVVLGVGCSGGLDFAVDVDYLYRFAVYVHTQLRENNFDFMAFIDPYAFEKLDQAVYYLITRGQFQAAAGAATATALGKITTENLIEAIDWWEAETANLNAANDIVWRVKNDPTMLKYTSPEVKGRLLHVLCHRNWRHLLSRSSWNLDGWYEDREEAAIKILELVQTQRDYQEVLEHMGFTDPVEDEEKARRRAESESRLMGLLDYKEEAWLREKKLKWSEKERQMRRAENWRRRLTMWQSELLATTDASEAVKVTAASLAHLRESGGKTDTMMA